MKFILLYELEMENDDLMFETSLNQQCEDEK
jgi:hypothetical protein